jgi:hypothetical protein
VRQVAANVLCSILLASAVAACGAGDSDVRQEVGAEAVDAEAIGSTEEPPTILFAGDSVMQELALGLTAALVGRANTSYIGLSDVAGNATAPPEWVERLEQSEPDLVVVMVGTWEAIAAAELPGGHATYPVSLQPFVEVLTARTDLLWLGYPKPQEEDWFTTDELVDHWSELPDQYERVTFLDAGAAIEEDGQFRTLLEVDGRQVLVRQIDGRHLCQDGVVLMARVVLEHLEEELGLEAAPGWETGEWRDPVTFEEDGLCPAGLGEPLAG